MDTIFTLKDGDLTDKINMDELYETKQASDMNTMNTFNKILNRIHNRIKTVSRQNKTDQFCWFLVPEVIIGVPKYNNTECITYIIDKLQTNGFNVKYTHPNLLFISWKHWVPGYVRTEIKKKTGLVVDGYGKEIQKNENQKNAEPDDPNALIFGNHKSNANSVTGKSQKDDNFKKIDTYKPTGNLIYNTNMLKKIEDKFQ